jgi:hypothetical protein
MNWPPLQLPPIMTAPDTSSKGQDLSLPTLNPRQYPREEPMAVRRYSLSNITVDDPFTWDTLRHSKTETQLHTTASTPAQTAHYQSPPLIRPIPIAAKRAPKAETNQGIMYTHPSLLQIEQTKHAHSMLQSLQSLNARQVPQMADRKLKAQQPAKSTHFQTLPSVYRAEHEYTPYGAHYMSIAKAKIEQYHANVSALHSQALNLERGKTEQSSELPPQYIDLYKASFVPSYELQNPFLPYTQSEQIALQRTEQVVGGPTFTSTINAKPNRQPPSKERSRKKSADVRITKSTWKESPPPLTVPDKPLCLPTPKLLLAKREHSSGEKVIRRIACFLDEVSAAMLAKSSRQAYGALVSRMKRWC